MKPHDMTLSDIMKKQSISIGLTIIKFPLIVCLVQRRLEVNSNFGYENSMEAIELSIEMLGRGMA